VFDGACVLPADLGALVCAAVFNDVDFALLVAHHDDRAIAYPLTLIAADFGHFAFQPHIVPGLAGEEHVHFFLIDGGVGVNPGRDACIAFFGPAPIDDDGRLDNGRRMFVSTAHIQILLVLALNRNDQRVADAIVVVDAVTALQPQALVGAYDYILVLADQIDGGLLIGQRFGDHEVGL